MGSLTPLLGQVVLASLPQPLGSAVLLPTRNSLLIAAEEHSCPSHGVQDEGLKTWELPVDLARREFGNLNHGLDSAVRRGRPRKLGLTLLGTPEVEPVTSWGPQRQSLSPAGDPRGRAPRLTLVMGMLAAASRMLV